MAEQSPQSTESAKSTKKSGFFRTLNGLFMPKKKEIKEQIQTSPNSENIAQNEPPSTKETAEKIQKAGAEHVKETAKKAKYGWKEFLGLNAKEAQAQAKKEEDNKIAKLTPEEREELKKAEELFNKGLMSIKMLIAPSAMQVQYDHVQIDGMYARTFFVYDYPRYIETNWLSPVINFEATMHTSLFIYPVSSGMFMRFLRKKVAEIRASIRISAEKGNVRDPALEAALQDAEELRDQLQRGMEKVFHFGMYVTIFAEDDKKLTKLAKQLQSLLAGRLVMAKPTYLQMEQGLNTTMPIARDEINIVRNMNTGPLSTSFPFTTSSLSSNDGILYGLNRHNESLVIFDRFSLENANSVVLAKSGAGKSFAVKLEVIRSLMMGTDVIILDPEHEYKALVETLGGTFINLSLNSTERINPFDLAEPVKDEITRPGDQLRSNIINLHGLLNLMLGSLTPEEEGLLDKALVDVYALKDITMDTVHPEQKTPPTMEDLQMILQNVKGAEHLGQRLQQYTTGTFSGIFNQETNINLDTGLIVFSTRDLEDMLRPIAMYVALNFIWNKVRSRLKKRILVIDEAWNMMQSEYSAKFLYGLVKRARKYYLGITTITQDVEDFIHNPYGKPIITNSSMQLLLKQSPASIEALKDTFMLTEGERYMLLASGVGQGLFFVGRQHVAIQVIGSYKEQQIVTTNPEELLARAGTTNEE